MTKSRATGKSAPAVPPRRRRLASPVVATLIVVGMAVMFGVGGYIASSLRATMYSVSAQVQPQPTPTLENADPTPSTVDQNNIFMQSQVAAMSSVPGRLPPGSTVAISQVGLSSILQVTATADSRSAAVAAANTVVQRYIALRNRQFQAYTARAQSQINLQLQQDSAALKAIDPKSPQAAAQRSALNSDYVRLVGLKRQLSLSAATNSATQVIHLARGGGVVAVSNKARNAVLAAIVGALIGVGIVVMLRRDAPSGSNPASARTPVAELARRP